MQLFYDPENPLKKLPVFHFRNDPPYGQPEHKGFYGPQDAIDKLIISHVAGVDYPSPAKITAVLQVLGPYAAGLLTLGGVALTLFITGRRERERSRLQRLDEHRREQRAIVSELLGVLNRYVREVNYMVRPNLWINGAEEEYRRAVEEINKVEANLDALFTRARLVVDDLPELVEALDSGLDAFLNASGTGKGVTEAFFAIAHQRGRRAKRAAVREIMAAEERAIEKLDEFSTTASALHAAAIDALAASIVIQGAARGDHPASRGRRRSTARP